MNIDAYKALPDNIKPLADEILGLQSKATTIVSAIADINRAITGLALAQDKLNTLLTQAIDIDKRDTVAEVVTDNAGC